MDDSLKHIDELFRSHLGSAGVTPPPGVFEQCVEQLDASGTEGQGLNQGASIVAGQWRPCPSSMSSIESMVKCWTPLATPLTFNSGQSPR